MNKLLMFQQAERNDAKRLGLSLQAFHLLCILAFLDGQPMRYYADKMGVTNAHITPMVDGLVAKGYAKRGRTLADHRMVLLQLTDKGREAINKTLKIAA